MLLAMENCEKNNIGFQNQERAPETIEENFRGYDFGFEKRLIASLLQKEKNKEPFTEDETRSLEEVNSRLKEENRFITELGKKEENGESFSRNDLLSLYEVNSKIYGRYGYGDGRITKLRDGRNAEEDMLVIFECSKAEIAHAPDEINENTKVYVGRLEPSIFQKLSPKVEHIYTSFPGPEIKRGNVKVGGKSGDELVSEMEAVGIKIEKQAEEMLLDKKKFVPTKDPENMTFIRLTIGDIFGDEKSRNFEEIIERARELGLELCPPDTGPNYRSQYRNQPLGSNFHIAMEPIVVNVNEKPEIFKLGHFKEDGLVLSNEKPETFMFNYENKFIFRFRESQS